jgi:hypothetical protein
MVYARNSRFTRDDEPTISCIHQDKNIDNEVHYVCIEFPDLIFVLTMMYTSYSLELIIPMLKSANSV